MTTQASDVVHYAPVGQPLCEDDAPEAAHTPAPTKIHYRDHAYVTSQFYFPDDFTDHVHRQTPYSGRPDRTTRNANDSVLRGDPAKRNLLASVTGDGDGYFGTIAVGVTA